jgi:hypothetical protein
VYGDQVILKYYLPENVKDTSIISISGIVHGYRYILLKYGYGNVPVDPRPYLGFDQSGRCNININCPEGNNWQKEKRAVALILVNGNRHCTGSLINNTNNDQYPYFLTANHCLGGYSAGANLNHWTFYWNYELPPNPNDCNYKYTTSTDPMAYSTSGAQILANNSTSDFALIELSEDPLYLSNYSIPYTPYYLGWDRTGNPGTGGVGIHHPRGDVKKITTYTMSPQSTTYLSTSINANASHWRVVWNSGTTEGGSSGSSLINNNSKIIGQLHGGYADCDNLNSADWYGKFSVSWTGGGTNTTRLSNWLDPEGTGVTTLNGIGAVDLLIKDNSTDVGIEPNPFSGVMYCSPDIWVRNQPYGRINQTHQNPIGGQTNYVYVRIKNIGVKNTLGTEKLRLYWTKASTGMSWPNYWNGTVYFSSTNKPTGGEIVVPPLAHPINAGGEYIAEISWNVPDPNDYTNISDPWHFCLLARIDAVNDPMTFVETSDVSTNTRNNNNIAWKNVSVVDRDGKYVSAAAVTNNDVKFKCIRFRTDETLLQWAEISIKFDPVLYNAWEKGGFGISNAVFRDDQTVLIQGTDARLNNVSLHNDEIGIFSVQVNFLTREMSNQLNFSLFAEQINCETEEIVGGNAFEIVASPRNPFYANAGNNIYTFLNTTIRLSAEDIGEDAVYKWYDKHGDLVSEEISFETAAIGEQTYKLEVIASADGYKDYDEVSVKIVPGMIEELFPNPTTDVITVSCIFSDPNNITGSFIKVSGYTGTVYGSYPLNAAASVSIDVGNYTAGTYTVSLICNGAVVDSKIFVKQ